MAKKPAGVAEQARHALTGDLGVLNTLAKEHAEVLATLALVRAEEGVMDRVRILDDLVLDLVSHAIAEDDVVYAALEQAEPELIRDSRDEHHRMEELLHELLAIEYSSPRWLARLDTLLQLVRRHVQEEEEDLFDVAKEQLSWARLRELDEAFQMAKAKCRERLRAGAFALPRG